MDYFEDTSASGATEKSKALYMQHEGLEIAAHIAMEGVSLNNISNTVRTCATQGKNQYLLFIHVSDNGTIAKSSSTGSNNASVLGKRRLSKAEKKKLTKQPKITSSENILKDEDDDNDDNNGNEEVAKLGHANEVDGMSLLFWVSALEEDAKDSAIDFSSHWLLLTPADVCQSFFSILA